MPTTAVQVEIWKALQRARVMPERVDFVGLLAQVEGAISQVPEGERLAVAGEIWLQVAEICAVRAERWMAEWNADNSDPQVELGFFDDLVRQSMAVDLTELMEEVPRRRGRSPSSEKPQGSVVAVVEKAELLALVDRMEAEKAQRQEVEAVCQDEDVTAWVEAIAQHLQVTTPEGLPFIQLYRGLEMPPVQVWMGVLLGGFQLRQDSSFYSHSFRVNQPATDL